MIVTRDSQEQTLADLVVELSRPTIPGRLLGRLVALSGIGLLVARLMRSPMRARWLTTRITRLHGRLLRLSQGRLRRSWMFAAGQPVLALTTTGRRSGRAHTTAVVAVVHEGKLATVGMNLGLERHPAWTYNLTAHPEATISLRGHTIPVLARRAQGSEREELWRRWLELQPSARAWAILAGREIPIFVLARRPDPARS